MNINNRIFTLDDQAAFAELSGDYNPLHVDQIAARRMLFGGPVVHGIHSLLWSLDCWLKDKTDHIKLRSIKTIFEKPIRVGEEISLKVKNEDEKCVGIELINRESVVTRIEFQWENSEHLRFECLETALTRNVQPHILSDDEMRTKSGSLELYLDMEATAYLFPRLAKCMCSYQIAALLGTSRLVGVECPGLHSIYTELKLNACDLREDKTMQYKVMKFERGSVFINIISPAMTGVIKALVRPACKKQECYLNLKNMVRNNAFLGQHALVLGGSRGLGEVTAKLLAAGGAKTKITYHLGEDDARRVVDEIVSNGGEANCFQFDILSRKENPLHLLLNGWIPSHLYYFATPFISSGLKSEFSTNLFNKFCDYYVSGFSSTVNSLRRLGTKNVFYPSTVYINDLPLNMVEYVTAKIAGEMICMFFEKSNRDIAIYRPRLPRMGTDQTVCLLPVNNQNPVPIMLEHLLLFRDVSVSQ